MDQQDNSQQGGYPQRQMFQGNWQCAGCSKEITELPFEPDGQRPIYCRDCYRQNKPTR